MAMKKKSGSKTAKAPVKKARTKPSKPAKPSVKKRAAKGAQPARVVRVGDYLKVRNEGGDFDIEVLGLSQMRGPAAAAKLLYRESDESREQRQKLAEERKAMPQFETAWDSGRPTKRDRRQLDRARGR